MHPFGGSSICPRCSRTVYAAEQAMGPGRKLYHKPCLACTSCSKRLDSFTLLEHDQEPYCKPCHSKNFGTRDLRQANLPHREGPPAESSLSSPQRDLVPSPPRRAPASPSPQQRDMLPAVSEDWSPPPSPQQQETPPRLKPTHLLSSRNNPPIETRDEAELDTSDATATQLVDGEQDAPPQPPIIPRLKPTHLLSSRNKPPTEVKDESKSNDTPVPVVAEQKAEKHTLAEDEETTSEDRDTVDVPLASHLPPVEAPRRFPVTPSRPSPLSPTYSGTANANGTGLRSSSPTYTGASSARPLSPTHTAPSSHRPSRSVPHFGVSYRGAPATLGRSNSSVTAMEMAGKPLTQTATGTRYGTVMGSSQSSPGSPTRRWGAASSVPTCPRCGKSVYFAEQVKAVNKTYHKGCLRCIECATLLDSSKLTEKDGEPMCHRCYGKIHGPQGGGYALLGKAGG